VRAALDVDLHPVFFRHRVLDGIFHELVDDELYPLPDQDVAIRGPREKPQDSRTTSS
jgi:hypothetical protein